ncbi:SUMF1/EgtB/PvdO family nonheme iron enzyme [Kitasatospora sp. RG8]|nr:SUMF1/EgtB/PvdO family nonheme iron enzyme [Kitasatospora sp. RG8]MBP0451044.1 SUMF1/EgtB/PvdO family nonheme iron enzyme [Kitasatospora sp. RG8]
MVRIPGGSFPMGSGGFSFYPEERPVHPVVVDGFWVTPPPPQGWGLLAHPAGRCDGPAWPEGR